TGKGNVPEAQTLLSGIFESADGSTVMIAYRFKYFLAPTWDGADYPPHLIREEVEYRPGVVGCGAATVVLKPSECDPWSDVEVVRVLGAVYAKGISSVRKGQVVAEIGPQTLATQTFTPYRHLHVDLR